MRPALRWTLAAVNGVIATTLVVATTAIGVSTPAVLLTALALVGSVFSLSKS